MRMLKQKRDGGRVVGVVPSLIWPSLYLDTLCMNLKCDNVALLHSTVENNCPNTAKGVFISGLVKHVTDEGKEKISSCRGLEDDDGGRSRDPNSAQTLSAFTARKSPLLQRKDISEPLPYYPALVLFCSPPSTPTPQNDSPTVYGSNNDERFA